MSLRLTQPNLIHPMLFLGALAAKKTVMYAAANTYGFHRIYRRILEFDRSYSGVELYRTPERRKFHDNLKESIRNPLHLIQLAKSPEFLQFIANFQEAAKSNPRYQQFTEQLKESGISNMLEELKKKTTQSANSGKK